MPLSSVELIVYVCKNYFIKLSTVGIDFRKCNKKVRKKFHVGLWGPECDKIFDKTKLGIVGLGL